MKKLVVIILFCLSVSLFGDTFESKAEAVDAAYATAIENHREYVSVNDNQALYDSVREELVDVVIAPNDMIVIKLKKGNFFFKQTYLVFVYKDDTGKVFTWIFK
jgi:hypothetical protein